MRDVIYLDQVEQAEVLLKPQRVEVLRLLAEPSSCTDVAQVLGQTPQRVYYHVKRLVDAGFVTQVAQRKVRGIYEGVYQASARSYWFSPQVVSRRDADEASLGYVLDLMAEVQADVAALDRARPELPSMGISGEIHVEPERRAEFFEELKGALQDVFTRYGGSEGDAFKLAIACYPKGEPDE